MAFPKSCNTSTVPVYSLDETHEEGGVVQPRPPISRVTPHIVHLPGVLQNGHAQKTPTLVLLVPTVLYCCAAGADDFFNFRRRVRPKKLKPAAQGCLGIRQPCIFEPPYTPFPPELSMARCAMIGERGKFHLSLIEGLQRNYCQQHADFEIKTAF